MSSHCSWFASDTGIPSEYARGPRTTDLERSDTEDTRCRGEECHFLCQTSADMYFGRENAKNLHKSMRSRWGGTKVNVWYLKD